MLIDFFAFFDSCSQDKAQYTHTKHNTLKLHLDRVKKKKKRIFWGEKLFGTKDLMQQIALHRTDYDTKPIQTIQTSIQYLKYITSNCFDNIFNVFCLLSILNAKLVITRRKFAKI